MEVLATMVLIGLILPVAMKGISIATALTSDTLRKQQAVALAESRLDEILLEQDWKNGAQAGTFEPDFPDYAWTLDTVTRPEPGLTEVDLTVTWSHRGHQKNIDLATLVFDEQ